MKFPKLTALLGLATLSFHASNIFGQKSHVRFSEEEVQSIEDALAENPNEQLQEQLDTANQLNTETAEAVKTAMETANLEHQHQESLLDNIKFLGEKCKEYGESKDRHTFAKNNGEEEPTDELIDGYLDPKDEHNQFLNQL